MLNDFGRDSSGTPRPIIGSVPDPVREEWEARQALLQKWEDVWVAIREAQKAFIDKRKRMPPSYYSWCGHEESEYNYETRIALSIAYLTFLQEE